MRAFTQSERPRLLAVELESAGALTSWPTRTWSLATHLTAVDVTLAVPAAAAKALPSGPTRLLPYAPDGAALQSTLSSYDAVLVHTFALQDFPFLSQTGLPLAVDLAVPFSLARLEASPPTPSDAQRGVFLEELRILNELLRVGDFFLCDSDAKRDFWLGALFANHRVNPHTLARGPDLCDLLDVVSEAPGREGARTGPLAAFCARRRRAPDHGLYVSDLERVAEDRADAIESLLEFNYWHRSSIDRAGAIEYLEGQVRDLKAELEHYRQGPAGRPRS